MAASTECSFCRIVKGSTSISGLNEIMTIHAHQSIVIYPIVITSLRIQTEKIAIAKGEYHDFDLTALSKPIAVKSLLSFSVQLHTMNGRCTGYDVVNRYSTYRIHAHDQSLNDEYIINITSIGSLIDIG